MIRTLVSISAILAVPQFAVAQPDCFGPYWQWLDGQGWTTTAIAAGDFNGDGLDDIAYYGTLNHNVVVLLNNGDGTRTVSYTGPDTGDVTPTMFASDMDGDGDIDISTGCTRSINGNYIVRSRTYLNNGDGTFQTPVISSAVWGASHELFDINNDGLPDQVVWNELMGSWLNDGIGTWINPVEIDQPDGLEHATNIEPVDVDRDKDIDFVALYPVDFFRPLGGTVVVYINEGEQVFTSGFSAFLPNTTPGCVKLADMNLDSHLDIVVSSGRYVYRDVYGEGEAGLINVFLSDGKGGYAPPLQHVISHASHSNNSSAWDMQIADFNHDGAPDVMTRGRTSGDNVYTSVQYNDGTGAFYHTERGLLSYTQYRNSALGDFNGDGAMDIAIGGGSSVFPDIRIYLNQCAAPCIADFNSDGVVDSADLATLLAEWGTAGASDLDGSGSVDSSDIAVLLAAWGDC